MATDRHLELCKILFSDRWRIIICTGLIWFNHANMMLYHSAFGSLAGIILIGDQCVPGVYFFGGHFGFGIKMPPPPSPTNKNRNIIENKKRIRRPKISGIRCITLVSVSHWSKSTNSTNPKCYLCGHFGFSIKMTPKRNFNTKNGFFALKSVESEVLL